MNKLPKTLKANDKASWLRTPVEYGPVGATLGQRKPRFRDRRTREAKALRDKRKELTAACGGQPSAVQATLIEHICQQYADLQMYGFRKATSEEPVSEHQDQLAVALYNTHERYVQAFAKTLPPPLPPVEEADKLLAAIRGMSTEACRALLKGIEGLEAEEIAERLEGGAQVVMVLPDNGRGDGKTPREHIAERIDGIAKRLAHPDPNPREPVSESPVRAEPEPLRANTEPPSANPEAPQSQQRAKKPQPAPKLPPNVEVVEIKPQTGRVSEGATVWTGR